MNEETFWGIIEKAGCPDLCPIEEQCERITAALKPLHKADLVAFESLRHQLLVKAYTWPMIKASFIVLSYTSDDVFEDFRHWIILNGRKRFYEATLKPDRLAEFMSAEDAFEEINGEPLLFACENAWSGKFEEIEKAVVYEEVQDITEEWPSKDVLASEFPKLFQRFWNEERIQEMHDDAEQ
ncbi:MAG: hypothetical protein ACI97A_001732 [Planctomycetota bacterium]|jgi:hypothetical protein